MTIDTLINLLQQISPDRLGEEVVICIRKPEIPIPIQAGGFIIFTSEIR